MAPSEDGKYWACLSYFESWEALSSTRKIGVLGSAVVLVLFMFVLRLMATYYWPWPNLNEVSSCGCLRTPLECLVKPYGGSWAKWGASCVLNLGLMVGSLVLPTVVAIRGRWVVVLSLFAAMLVGVVVIENVVPPTHNCSVLE